MKGLLSRTYDLLIAFAFTLLLPHPLMAAGGAGGGAPPSQLPSGGTTGQVLKKNSDANADWGWATDLTAASGAGTAITEFLCDGTDRTAALQTVINIARMVMVSGGICIISGNGITLRSNLVIMGSGNGRNFGTVAATVFQWNGSGVDAEGNPKCAFNGGGASTVSDVYLTNFGVQGTSNGTDGICIAGFGNGSKIENIRLRALSSGLRFYDSDSDHSAAWYGAVDTIFVDVIADCVIEVDAGARQGGAGPILLSILNTDINHLDGRAVCINRGNRFATNVTIIGGIWSSDAAGMFVEVNNSPDAIISLIGVKVNGNTSQDIVRANTNDVHVSMIGVSGVSNPTTPTFCAQAVDYPSATDIQCSANSGFLTIFPGTPLVSQ